MKRIAAQGCANSRNEDRVTSSITSLKTFSLRCHQNNPSNPISDSKMHLWPEIIQLHHSSTLLWQSETQYLFIASHQLSYFAIKSKIFLNYNPSLESFSSTYVDLLITSMTTIRTDVITSTFLNNKHCFCKSVQLWWKQIQTNSSKLLQFENLFIVSSATSIKRMAYCNVCKKMRQPFMRLGF